MTPPRRDVARYDPLLNRYRAECPTCDHTVVRKEREAAERDLSQHYAREHGTDTSARATS